MIAQKRMWAPLWLAIMLAQPILAQTWTQKSPTTKPPARSDTALASLDQQQKTVLFGGKAGYDSLNDTWLWDGVTWTQFTGTTAPPTLYGHAMAADSPNSVVVFGGWGPTGEDPLNQTWRFDGSKWTQIGIGALAPNWRDGHAMAYDRNANQIVMFGGYHQGNDTWVFKNSAWTQVFPTTAPPVGGGLALAYDAERRQVVLFGGTGYDDTGHQVLLDETWVWDSGSTTWNKKTPAHSPPARFGHALVYDSAAHQVVLFGGTGVNDVRVVGFHDTWTWDGTDWTQKNTTTAPPAKAFFGFAERSWAGDAVLFGGYDWTTNPSWAYPNNDTWVWQSPRALVQQPINPNGSSVFNANRGVVPVKFTLMLEGLPTCTLPAATISVKRISGGTATAIDESVYTGAADSGSNFRIDARNCQYIYNLSASALGVGTYQVNILIDGNAVGSATFGLK